LGGDPERGSLPPRGGYQTVFRGNIMSSLLFCSMAWWRTGRWKRSPVRVTTQNAHLRRAFRGSRLRTESRLAAPEAWPSPAHPRHALHAHAMASRLMTDHMADHIFGRFLSHLSK
jgi:hypothetical protein